MRTVTVSTCGGLASIQFTKFILISLLAYWHLVISTRLSFKYCTNVTFDLVLAQVKKSLRSQEGSSSVDHEFMPQITHQFFFFYLSIL